MMRIDIITALPELIKIPFEASIMKLGEENNLDEVHLHDLRRLSLNRYGQIEDYQYGGGAGIVLMIEPLDKCISNLKSDRDYDEVIYLTPDGKTLDQTTANELSLKGNLMMICGHYKGVDQRVRDLHVTKEISIGNYVLI